MSKTLTIKELQAIVSNLPISGRGAIESFIEVLKKKRRRHNKLKTIS